MDLRKQKPSLRFFCLCLFLILITFAAVNTAYARMGGGQSFGGGGYSSSSGYGGSSGSSSGGDGVAGLLIEIAFRIIIEICIYHPTIGIPLLVIFVGGWIYMGSTGNSLTVKSFNESGSSPAAPSTRMRDKAVEEIKNRTPIFQCPVHRFCPSLYPTIS